MISEVKCPDRKVSETHENIKEEAVRFFSAFLNNKPDNYVGATEAELGNLIKFRCTMEESGTLTKEVSAEEIKSVLFAMPSKKSPGPDGFPCDIFKTTWPIIS